MVVTELQWQRWAQPVETHIAILYQQEHSKLCKTQILHIQLVKSCGARVDHRVLDMNRHPCPLID